MRRFARRKRWAAPIASRLACTKGGTHPLTEGKATMSFADKAKNAAQDAAGKAKEAAGKATDNEDLQVEGKGDQAEASFKNAGEKAKDAIDDVKKGFSS